MALDPRAIALQGVGYGALVLALQGFVALPQEQPQGSVGARYPHHLLKVDPALRGRIRDDDELVLAIICGALQSGLLEPQ